MSQFIQVGVTAMRDPSGKFQEAIPLYIQSNSVNEEAQRKLMDDIGRLFAARMRMEAVEAGTR